MKRYEVRQNSGLKQRKGETPEGDTMSTEQAKQDRMRIAKARVEAARLRVLAAQHDEMVAGYTQQAAHPIYADQALICAGKAAQAAAIAAETRARADLIEAEAGI